jgi:hypothetical protein
MTPVEEIEKRTSVQRERFDERVPCWQSVVRQDAAKGVDQPPLDVVRLPTGHLDFVGQMLRELL